jgi:hypothetical protein
VADRFLAQPRQRLPEEDADRVLGQDRQGPVELGAACQGADCHPTGGIRGWSVACRSYEDCPGDEATWFIDPPYGDKGKYYRHKFSDFAGLGQWSQARKGLVIVCEGPGADWLPFRPLGDFKSSKGHAQESVYIRESTSESEAA